MKDKSFSLKFGAEICEVVLICMWSTELDYAKLDHSEQNHAKPNQSLHHQSVM